MLVNTQYFSPVALEGITKADPRSLEYADWWREEKRRCIEGYEVGGVRITGDHYWYLNYWKIKGLATHGSTGRKGLVNPRFLDMDFMFFNEVEKARDVHGLNLLALKARQKGFSEKAASIMGKEFSLFPHSQTLITAGEDKYSINTMRMCIKGLNALDGTEFFKRRNPDTMDLMISRYKELKDGNVVWKGYHSEIHNITAKNNVQALIGKSPSFVYFEEAGRFKGLKDVYNYILPAIEAEGKKTGFILLAGTGGEMEAGVDELAEMFYNPSAYGLMAYDNIWEEDIDTNNVEYKKVCYFVPAYLYQIIDSDGNSLVKESKEFLLSKREDAKKAKSQEKYYNELTQRPFTPSEALLVTGGNMFNQVLLNSRLAEIRRSKELSNLAQYGDLVWKKDSIGKITGIEWQAKKDGPFVIYEHPEKDQSGGVYRNLYVAGTDSYDYDIAGGKQIYGSKGSCSIFKKFLNADTTYKKFVARLTQRPKTAFEFYENTAKLCVYYGHAKNLIEYSNLRIFDWYKANGFTYLLKERPKVAYANVSKTTATNPYGIHAATKEEWLSAMKDYIEDYYDLLDDPVQIEALIKFVLDKEYNCDITISSCLAIIHEMDDKMVKAKDSQKQDFKPFGGYKMSSGKIIHS